MKSKDSILWQWPEKQRIRDIYRLDKKGAIELILWIFIGVVVSVVYWEFVDRPISIHQAILFGILGGVLAGFSSSNNDRKSWFIYRLMYRFELTENKIKHTHMFFTNTYKISGLGSKPRYNFKTSSFNFVYKGKLVKAILKGLNPQNIEDFNAAFEKFDANKYFKTDSPRHSRATQVTDGARPFK